jgi:hypothetical protein
LFLVFSQIILCLAIIFSGEVTTFNSTQQINLGFLIHIAYFFTIQVMHYGGLAIVRNGMQIMKFVVFHSEELQNPIEVFILGLLVLVANMLCAITNVLSSMS